jgi:hypothetical protein
MGHIDPGTGRNKRETGKLAKMRDRAEQARAEERDRQPSGGIRKRDGKPVEKRVDQKKRNKVYPPGVQPVTEFWQRADDAMTYIPPEWR